MARFTDRQIDDAKNTDLAVFLRRRGETLVRSGGEYRLVYRDGSGEHDSITIRGNRWFDHKRQIGGDAIGFLQEFDGMEFRKAVATLISAEPSESKHTGRNSALITQAKKRKPFVLPPRNTDMRRLYAYLCKTRGIGREVVSHFVRAGVLYEDAEYHNAVFVAADEKNKARGGLKKSTHTESGFRQTIEGSDTRYAFRHRGSSGRVFVFEAAVDMLSYITMHPKSWQEHSYLALDGLSPKSLFQFLSENAEVREIVLCLDNDDAGIAAAEKIARQLAELGYADVSVCLPTHKDWNEDIQNAPEIEMSPEVVM